MDANTAQLLFFVVIIGVIVLLMVRNSRKRQRDQLALSQGLKPGAEIMTTFGVFGTITAIDDDENRITVRTSPTSELTIHRQAVGRVVTPKAEEAGTVLNGEAVVLDDAASDPRFAERVDTAEPGVEDTAASRRTGRDTGPAAD